MTQPRVLLVDDEPQVRTFVTAILKQRRFQVEQAGDGCEALDVLSNCETPIDLLVTDIKMPRMDGIALAHAVSASYPRLPVLSISGLASDPLRSPDLNRPGYAFLQKPFPPKALIEAVERLLAPKTNSAENSM
jgi:two-component system, cell cycle response regulator CpdR